MPGSPRRSALGAVAIVVAATALAPGASAGAKVSAPSVSATIPTTVSVARKLHVTGSVAHAGRRARVVLERQVGGRWAAAGKGSLRHGKFKLSWRAPAKAGQTVMRVAVLKHKRVLATSAAQHVLVSARVAVVHPGAVTAAPAPGQPGALVVHGYSSAKPGDVIALGIGPNTPYGFLGKVTGVSRSGGDTHLSTEPTTLLDAVPNGSIDATLGSATGKARRRRLTAEHPISKSVSCKGGGSVEVHGSVSLTPSVRFQAHWHWDWLPWNSGVDSASLTGKLTANADLAGAAKAAASCTLAKTQIAEFTLPPIDVQVGPVPVVLVPRVVISVSADGSVESSLSTGVHGSLSATAGVKYDHGDFSPVGGASAKWTYDPPVVDSTASLGGRVTPAIQVLLYGVAGPELSLTTGLQFDADTSTSPWWTLTAPLDVNASLKAPVLGLDSGELNIYHHDFMLAQNDNAPPGPPQPTDAATISWDTDGTDIDLHAFDAGGDHAWYGDQQAIPGGQLSADVTDGYGPEAFSIDDPSTDLGFGICYYRDNSGASTPTPTTVTIEWYDPTSQQTTTDMVMLDQPGDYATYGDTGLVPADATTWCHPHPYTLGPAHR